MVARALAIEGLTKRSEVELLHRLARTMPPGALVVEVGSFRGRSTVAIAAGLEDVEGARLVAVDPFTGDPGEWERPSAGDARAMFDTNTQGIPFLEVIQATSVEAAGRFAPGSIDWVFLDGLHDYANVRRDIVAWSPLVKPGGLLSGHDYGRMGVADAVLAYFEGVTTEHSIWMTRDPARQQWGRRIRAEAKNALGRAGLR